MAQFNVGSSTIDDDLMIGEKAEATGLKASTRYIAELTDGQSIYVVKAFTTLGDEEPSKLFTLNQSLLNGKDPLG